MKFLLPLIILAGSLAVFGQGYAFIRVENAKMRSRPAGRAPLVANLTQGALIKLKPGKSVPGWVQVIYGDKSGWIRAGSYIRAAALSKSPVLNADQNGPLPLTGESQPDNLEKSPPAPPETAPLTIEKSPPVTEPVKSPVPAVLSGGVLNNKALVFVKAEYPEPARPVHAQGAVSVQVLIDENGDVVSAAALSGHPLLRFAAVKAARACKFEKTVIRDQAVKVSGILVYNFVP